MTYTVLGIETSCDETALALVRSDRTVLAEVVFSQFAVHENFGGVVPELAARAHLQRLPKLMKEIFNQVEILPSDLSAIAAVGGPGLLGGVIIGTMYGKALSAGLSKPFLAVNHLEAHALVVRLEKDISFPYLLLLVSGGHTQFLWVKGVGEYKLLGTTMDDALGEAFDKTAKLLELPYPGGPEIERLAQIGDTKRFSFPKPMIRDKSLSFSFSGLKTAVRQVVFSLPSPLSEKDKADIAASFQDTIGSLLEDKVARAITYVKETFQVQRFPFVLAGGVAANLCIRERLSQCVQEKGGQFFGPSSRFCTDNGVMIAWAGLERLRADLIDTLEFAPRPRWPLEELSYKKIYN